MYGIDIAKDRFDEQDKQILQQVLSRDWNPKKCLILGSGEGRIGIVLALLGFEVVCIDIDDYSQKYADANNLFEFPKPITFIQKSLADLQEQDFSREFTLVVLQRVLHYLPYVDQVKLLGTLPGYITKPGFLYLAVSSVDSDMGIGYGGLDIDITERFHKLSPEMQERFSLKAPVCLHSRDEFKTLMKGTHFKKKDLYQTSFGNIKSLYQL